VINQQAWTGAWRGAENAGAEAVEAAVSPAVRRDCIALSLLEEEEEAGRVRCVCRWLHQPGALGEPVGQLSVGSHAFVKALGEPFLRVSPVSFPFGGAGGHPMLASEEAVLYAGELEVGEQGEVVRWNNCSGTYKAADAMCFQTGLPLDKFWALVPGGPPGAAEPGRHWVSAGGVVMRRVLRLDDAEYEAVRARWQAHVGRLCRRDSEAAACRALLEQASEERVEAVGQYGYLTRVGEGDGPDGGVATQRMPSDTLAAVAIGRSKSRGRMWR